MTSKEREELEYRRKLQALERETRKARHAEMRAIADHHADLLCTFYNLEIEPRIKSSVSYPDLVGTLKSTKGVLNQRDVRRVKRFLRKIIREDTILMQEKMVEERKWERKMNREQGIVEPDLPDFLEEELELLEWYRNRERSEWLPDDKWKAWRKSRGQCEFIAH